MGKFKEAIDRDLESKSARWRETKKKALKGLKEFNKDIYDGKGEISEIGDYGKSEPHFFETGACLSIVVFDNGLIWARHDLYFSVKNNHRSPTLFLELISVAGNKVESSEGICLYKQEVWGGEFAEQVALENVAGRVVSSMKVLEEFK